MKLVILFKTMVYIYLKKGVPKEVNRVWQNCALSCGISTEVYPSTNLLPSSRA